MAKAEAKGRHLLELKNSVFLSKRIYNPLMLFRCLLLGCGNLYIRDYQVEKFAKLIVGSELY